MAPKKGHGGKGQTAERMQIVRAAKREQSAQHNSLKQDVQKPLGKIILPSITPVSLIPGKVPYVLPEIVNHTLQVLLSLNAAKDPEARLCEHDVALWMLWEGRSELCQTRSDS